MFSGITTNSNWNLRLSVTLSMSDVQDFSGDSKGAGYNDMSALDVLAICLRRRDNRVWCRGEEGSKSAIALFKEGAWGISGQLVV